MTLRNIISNPKVDLDMELGANHSSGSTSSDVQVMYDSIRVVHPDQWDEEETT